MADDATEPAANAHRRTPVVVQTSSQRWTGWAGLVIALIAVGVAVWALMSVRAITPAAAEQQSAAEQPSGDAKASVCDAFTTVTRAVQAQTHADPGPDPIAQQAVAGNARLALIGGGDYLLRQLGPGTPTDLADAVRAFAENLQKIGLYALADVPGSDPAQAARLSDGEKSRAQIADLCK